MPKQEQTIQQQLPESPEILQTIASNCGTIHGSQSRENASGRFTINENIEEMGSGDVVVSRAYSLKRGGSLDGSGFMSIYKNLPSVCQHSANIDGSISSGGEKLKSRSHSDVFMALSRQRQFDSPGGSAPYFRMSHESGRNGCCPSLNMQL